MVLFLELVTYGLAPGTDDFAGVSSLVLSILCGHLEMMKSYDRLQLVADMVAI